LDNPPLLTAPRRQPLTGHARPEATTTPLP
jgi:hypothetical protein